MKKRRRAPSAAVLVSGHDEGAWARLGPFPAAELLLDPRSSGCEGYGFNSVPRRSSAAPATVTPKLSVTPHSAKSLCLSWPHQLL